MLIFINNNINNIFKNEIIKYCNNCPCQITDDVTQADHIIYNMNNAAYFLRLILTHKKIMTEVDNAVIIELLQSKDRESYKLGEYLLYNYKNITDIFYIAEKIDFVLLIKMILEN